MIRKLRNLLLNELFYLIVSAIIILMIVVARGIFFDDWYRDWRNMGLAGGAIYVTTILYRVFFHRRKTSARKSKN